jgi:hypothetical protein
MTAPADYGLWPAAQRPPSHPVSLSDAEALAVAMRALEAIGYGLGVRSRWVALEALAKIRGER